MAERKMFGSGIEAGRAVILVKEKGLGKKEHPFWNWLKEEGFHDLGLYGDYGMDWIYINLNSMVYAPGIPGVKLVMSIRGHAITTEEFKTIWGIYKQYEGLSVFEMSKKDAVIMLAQDQNGEFKEYELTLEETKRLLKNKKTPTVRDLAKDRLVQEWLKNPSWREYFEKAPSEKCKKVIVLGFVYSELETEESLEELDAAEKELALEDWQYLYRYALGPEKKRIHDRIVELGGEI